MACAQRCDAMRGNPTARTAPPAVPGPGIYHFPGTVPAALRYGAAKKGSPALSTRVDQLLSAIEVLPLDDGVDGGYGDIRTALEKAGTPIGANDDLLAAHALAADLTRVTDNVREFSRVPGLAAETWLAS